MEERLGVAAVNWVNRIGRSVAPWALGFFVAIFALASPGVNPVAAMTGEFDEPRVDFVVMAAAAAVCGLAAALARRWRWPLFLITIVCWTYFSMYPAMMASSYYAATHLTKRRHAITFLSIATAVTILPAGIGLWMKERDVAGGIFIGVVAVALLVGLPYAIGLWVSARRQVIAGLHERAARLESEQAARADQARAEERARIAREMHDVVAHRVALMVLHAGALEVNAADAHLAQEAALIRTTGREALAELRQVLGVLRTPDSASLLPQPDLADLARLVAQTRAAGLAVTQTETGTPRALPLTVQRTAYRVVQEALTNVVKHTGGAAAVVTLRYLPDAVEVKVENGPPAASIEKLPGSGLGLIGLQERVALLAGRFEARPRLDGGFTVTAILPDDAAEVLAAISGAPGGASSLRSVTPRASA